MRYQNSREAFLAESKYVGQVSSIVSVITNTGIFILQNAFEYLDARF